ncbi:hypothetical protein ES703_113550 [subsurface metagenome]
MRVIIVIELSKIIILIDIGKIIFFAIKRIPSNIINTGS